MRDHKNNLEDLAKDLLNREWMQFKVQSFICIHLSSEFQYDRRRLIPHWHRWWVQISYCVSVLYLEVLFMWIRSVGDALHVWRPLLLYRHIFDHARELNSRRSWSLTNSLHWAPIFYYNSNISNCSPLPLFNIHDTVSRWWHLWPSDTA